MNIRNLGIVFLIGLLLGSGSMKLVNKPKVKIQEKVVYQFKTNVVNHYYYQTSTKPPVLLPKKPVKTPLLFIATAYTNGYESTQKHKGDKGYGITASGTQTVEGRTLACPKPYPFGTKMYVREWHKIYICEDRGGAIKGNRLDVFFNQLKQAYEFGRQTLHIDVLGG